jgi:S1-C subfamily serine protease
MFKNHSPKNNMLYWQRWLLSTIFALLLACIPLFGTIASSTTFASAASQPGGDVSDPVVQAVDIAEPAVVRIFTTVGGHLAVQFSSTNTVSFPQGQGNSYPLLLSGTGTFISAHGDILTADHVINPPHDQSLAQFLDQTAEDDVANYMNQHGQNVSASQVDQELESGQLASTPSYDPATSEVYLNTSYTGPLSASNFSGLPYQIHAAVDRIEMQSSFQNTDVAIVHVAMNDTPSVQLGDSSNVQQQDQLTIIGFPGNGDVSNKPTDLLTASVNQIEVSSIKTTDTGAPVIQVGGNVEHGDSGGPALDSTGQVVGIVSFGLSSDGTSGGTSFLQASNSAESLVQNLHLNTTPGTFQKDWSQGFDDYASNAPGHWHKAAREFALLASSYPLFKAISPYLSYAQTQARSEHVSLTSTKTATTVAGSSSMMAEIWTIVGIAVVVLLVLLLCGVLIWHRRRKRSKQASIPGNTNGAAAPPIMGQAVRAPNQPVISNGQARTNVPSPAHQWSAGDDAMTAFGAPPQSQAQQPSQTQSSPRPLSVVSGTLLPWPCGHMNRPNARYCSICGEPAPQQPSVRKFEQ